MIQFIKLLLIKVHYSLSFVWLLMFSNTFICFTSGLWNMLKDIKILSTFTYKEEYYFQEIWMSFSSDAKCRGLIHADLLTISSAHVYWNISSNLNTVLGSAFKNIKNSSWIKSKEFTVQKRRHVSTKPFPLGDHIIKGLRSQIPVANQFGSNPENPVSQLCSSCWAND